MLGTSCSLMNLTELSLNGAYKLSDDGLECILKATKNLERLSLQYCSELAGSFLACLSTNAKGLKHLDLTECRGISGDMLTSNLPLLSELSTLNLDGNQEVRVLLNSKC